MKHALGFYGLLLATLLMSSACGADSPDVGGGNDAGDTIDAASIDATPVCEGCLDVFGNCEAGDQDMECGGGGAICESCTNDAVCAENECITPPSCTPANCDGCCDGNNCVLVAAQDAAQCGSEGLACTSCDSGICTEGVCIEACTPATCSGCCDGPTINDCIEIGSSQTAAACGMAGLACAPCNNGATCTQGECVDTQCNLDCPDGCYDGQTCRDGDSDNECGIGGEACFSCGPDQTCSTGICVVDPTSLWNFVVVSADVPTTDSGGSAWDPFGGAPDLYVEATLGVDTASPESGTTATVNSTFSVQFSPPNGETVITNVPASKILDSIRLRVYDDDPGPDDLMVGIIDNTPPESVFGGSLFTLSTGTGANTFTIRFRVVKP